MGLLGDCCGIEDTVVAVFADSRYADVLDNWLVAARNLEIDEVVVGAFDAPLYERLRESGTNVLALNPTERPLSLAEFWHDRLKCILQMLEEGFDVIHSDADAVWLRDPRAQLSAADADVMFSQGTIWPEDVHAHWGFVACCGFFEARSTDATRSFFARCLARTEELGDDQIAVNRELVDMGVEWTFPFETHYRVFRDRKIVCADENIVGQTRDNALSVAVVPHGFVSRVPRAGDACHVLHPVSDKDAESTLASLASHGCLYLDEAPGEGRR